MLEVISVDGGFYTNLGFSVTLEPAQLNSKLDQMGGKIYVVEDDSEVDDEVKGARSNLMNVVLESYLPVSESDSQLKAHMVRSDILKAIPTRAKGFPIGVTSISTSSRKILQRPEGFPYTVVQIKVQIGLVEPAAPST